MNDGRLIIEKLDENGNVEFRDVGPSQDELRAEHEARKCNMFCSYCIVEAEEFKRNEAQKSN